MIRVFIDMEQPPSVTWFESDVSADSVALEFVGSFQSALGIGMSVAAVPLRPNRKDLL